MVGKRGSEEFVLDNLHFPGSRKMVRMFEYVLRRGIKFSKSYPANGWQAE